ncbi:MAG: hypothetical protein ACLRSW_03515 [Christensenellaceae bacterium]
MKAALPKGAIGIKFRCCFGNISPCISMEKWFVLPVHGDGTPPFNLYPDGGAGVVLVRIKDIQRGGLLLTS